MKISASSNIYEVTTENVLDAYAPFVEFGADGASGAERKISRLLAIALSTAPLGAAAREAVEKSLQALGYGADCCAFATTAAEGAELGGPELLSLTEGLDPLLLIICDARCAETLAKAYHARIEPGLAGRLLGRPYVAFADFESLMETPEDKQKAWALLKRLPKLP